MIITYLDFLYAVLFAARCMDECWPELEAEKLTWESYSFGNDGAHYLPQEQRPPGFIRGCPMRRA